MADPTIIPIGTTIADALLRKTTTNNYNEVFAEKDGGLPSSQALGATKNSLVESMKRDTDIRVRQALADAGASQDQYDKWETAKAIAEYRGVPALEVMKRIDEYAVDYFGDKPDYKTAPKAILDFGVAQAKMVKVGKLYSEMNGWSAASLLGRSDSEIEAEIEALKKSAYSLMSDVIPRGEGVKVAKMLAGAIPYTGEMVVQGAVVGAAVSAVGGSGGAAAPAALAAIKASAITMFGLAKGFEIMSGMEYGEMISNGVDKSVAKTWAPIYGLTAAAVEQVLGVESFVSGSLSSKVVQSITNKIAAKIGISGVLTAASAKVGKELLNEAWVIAAKKTAIGVLVNTVSESGEEGIQALDDAIVRFAAEALTEELGGEISDPMTIGKMAESIKDDMVGALIISPFLGVFGHIGMGISNYEAAIKMAKSAPHMDKPDFIKAAVGANAFTPAGTDAEEAADVAGQVYDAQIKRALDDSASDAQVAAEAVKEGGPVAGVERMDDGSLRVEQKQTGTNTDGTRNVDYTAGAARGKGDIYGNVETVIDGTKNTVTITGADIQAEYATLSPEVFSNIAALNPGRELLISDDIDPVIKSAFDKFISERGPVPVEKEIDVEVAMEEERIRKEMRDTGMPESVIETSMAPMRIILEAMSNISGKEKIEAYKGLKFAQSKGKSTVRRGGTSYKVEGSFTSSNIVDPVTGMKEFVHGTILIPKGMIEHGESVNTVVHETAHYMRKWLSKYAADDAFNVFEKEYGATRGRWNQQAEEMFVEDLLRFLRDRKADSSAKTDVFGRIATLFKALWNSIKGQIPMSKEIREQFEQWFSESEIDPDEVMLDPTISLNTAAKPEVAEYHPATMNNREKMKRTFIAEIKAKGMTDARIDEMFEKYGDSLDGYSDYLAGIAGIEKTDLFSLRIMDEADGIAGKYRGTDQYLKAPNGKPSNLNEKQWAQVRTKAFKEWFGDWENDPANASKVVDENGEPLVVYHGTGAGVIEEYDPARPNFFTASEEYADVYTYKGKKRNIGKVFLSMENPADNTNSAEVFNNEFIGYWTNKYPTSVNSKGGIKPIKQGEYIPFIWADEFWGFLRQKEREGKTYFDGIFVDEGGVAEDYGGKIAYVPLHNTQIKSVDNRGTWSRLETNIYHSLKEISEAEEAFEYAKSIHGLTSDIEEAGYVLPNGEMLNFMRKTLPMGHSMIRYPAAGNKGPSMKVDGFVNYGAMRIDAIAGIVQMHNEPTAAQKKVILDIVDGSNSPWIELRDGKRTAAFSPEGGGKKALGVIHSFFLGADLVEETYFSLAKVPEAIVSMDDIFKYATEMEEWKDWYERNDKLLEEVFGEDAGIFKQLLSATSQRTDVQGNVTYAIKAYNQILMGLPFTGYMGVVINNLNRIREGMAVRGPKISEFSKSNQGDTSGVAVDMHIAELLFGINPTIDKNGKKKTRALRVGEIALAKKMITSTAERLGWHPNAVQAALWAYNKLINRGEKNADSFDVYINKKLDEIKHIQASRKVNVEGRMKAMEDGTWVLDDQIVAELKQFRGEDLSEYETDLLAVAADVSEQNEVPDLLYSLTPDTEGEGAKFRGFDEDARSYRTFEEWLDATYMNPELLTDKDKAFLKARFDHAHGPTGNVRKFKRPGDFANFIATRSGITTFISKIDSIINSHRRYITEESAAHAARVEAALSRTPEAMNMVEAYNKDGKAPTTQAARVLIANIRKYEPLYKYLYAMLDADQDLAHEALDDLSTVPELVKRDLVGREQTTIAEQQMILDALKNTAIYDSMMNGTATMDEIDQYIDAVIASEKTEAADNMKSAIEQAKMSNDEVKNKYREREAARKLRAEIRKIKAFIFRAPSGSVDLEQASIIRAIQEALEAGRPIDAEKLRASGMFIFQRDPEALQDVIDIVNSVSEKPFGQWSIAELKEIAGIIGAANKEGRDALRNAQLAFGYKAKASRGKINRELRNSKYYKKYLAPGSEEYKERSKKLDLMGIQFDADRPDAFLRKYLGDEAYRVMFQRTVDAHRRKYESYDERVAPVRDFIEKTRMAKDRTLFQKVNVNGLGPNGSSFTITKSELIGIRLLVGTEENFNPEQREAFIYGNLFSADEKNADGNLTVNGEKLTNDKMRDAYKAKVDGILQLIKDNLTADEETLAKLMLAVTDNDTHWMRFANAVYKLANKEPKKSKFYFPIFREGIFTPGEDEIIDALAGSGVKVALDQGMSMSRVQIQPRNQKHVNIDSMRIFFSAIEKQEHLINVGMHAKMLHAVFANNIQGEALMDNIEQSLGKKATDYLTKQIDTITNPSQFREPNPGGALLRFFRGSMVISNLAWRWSTILMQHVTSPLPFLSEVNPAELLAVAMKAYVHPVQFVKDAESNSATLRHRQMTPEVANLGRRVEQGVATFMERLSQKGMAPLTGVDRFAVAIGWEAVRQKALRKFAAENDAKADTDPEKLNDGEVAEKAMAYADEVIIKTQPTSEEVYRAPMYQQHSEFAQLMLQFTQPLNVIYNNIRHDIPQAVRDNEMPKVMGFIMAYALSGAAIGAIAALRGMGPDDPDKEKWVRYFIHAGTMQFTDSIPLVGPVISSLTRKLIVGDTDFRQDRNMPAVELFYRGGMNLLKDDPDFAKAFWTMAEGTGMMFGAPTRAVKEYATAITGLLGKAGQ